jgi:CRP-like cAMP-binding protein
MLLEDRLAQIVPTLTPAQIEFALRFASGPAKHFAPDEKLLDVGDRNMAVWLVIEGSIVASRRDGLGRERIFATGGPGQFSGEVSDLAGHASLAMVCAGPDGCTLPKSFQKRLFCHLSSHLRLPDGLGDEMPGGGAAIHAGGHHANYRARRR